MQKTILEQIDRRVIALYDDFTHRHFDRRLFLEKLTALVGATTAAAMLPLLRSNSALAEQVKSDDPRLMTQSITYPGSSGEVKGYIARPTGSDKLPGVIVIHQNRGLNAHIDNGAARRARRLCRACAGPCHLWAGRRPTRTRRCRISPRSRRPSPSPTR